MKVRIGNDISVTWTILDGDGNPYDLTGRDIEVHLRSFYIDIPMEFTTADNVISFTFYGKDQKAPEKYNLLLVENRGGIPMVVYDIENAFELVKHSWERGGGNADGVEVDESVDIVSSLAEGEARKIRIGNDLTIQWTLYDGDTPYDLTGRDFEIWVTRFGTRQQMTGLSVVGNVVTFTFFGKDQRIPGKYDLVYIENKGEAGMVTYDTRDVFELAEHSWDTEGGQESEVVADTIELVSQITANGISAEQIIEALGYVPYDKPSGGIPASDLASGVIPDVSGFVETVTPAVKKIWTGTQSQYDALTPADDTIYFIKEDK